MKNLLYVFLCCLIFNACISDDNTSPTLETIDENILKVGNDQVAISFNSLSKNSDHTFRGILVKEDKEYNVAMNLGDSFNENICWEETGVNSYQVHNLESGVELHISDLRSIDNKLVGTASVDGQAFEFELNNKLIAANLKSIGSLDERINLCNPGQESNEVANARWIWPVVGGLIFLGGAVCRTLYNSAYDACLTAYGLNLCPYGAEMIWSPSTCGGECTINCIE